MTLVNGGYCNAYNFHRFSSFDEVCAEIDRQEREHGWFGNHHSTYINSYWDHLINERDRLYIEPDRDSTDSCRLGQY